MSSRAASAYKSVVAIVCMALSFLLSSQTALAVAHQIEHVHHIPHNHALLPDDLLGAVIYLSHDVSSTAADVPASSETSKHQDNHATDTGHHHEPHQADHQHDGSVIVFLVSQHLTLINSPLPRLPCEFVPRSLVTFNPSGPEHPPKYSLDTRV